MDIPITIELTAEDATMDRACHEAIRAAKVAVREYSEDISYIKKLVPCTCFDIEFIRVRISCDLLGEDKYIYEFKVVD